MTSGLRPQKKKGKAIGHILLAPVLYVANSAKWLTCPTSKGGGKYVIKTMAIYFLLLSVENCYVTFGGNPYLPKPYQTNKSTDINRVLPFGDIGNSIIGTASDMVNLVGVKVYKPQPFYKTDLIVWADPKFLVALVFTLLINTMQAIALRKLDVKTLGKELSQSLNKDSTKANILKSYEDPEAEYKSLETHKLAAQVKTHGNLETVFLGILTIASWVYESAMFSGNSPIGTSPLVTIALTLCSVFGYETMERFSDTISKRGEEEKE